MGTQGVVMDKWLLQYDLTVLTEISCHSFLDTIFDTIHHSVSDNSQVIYPPIICGHFSPVCPDNELLTPLLLTEKYNPFGIGERL